MPQDLKTHNVLLLLGANQGECHETIKRCRVLLSLLAGEVVRTSSLYQTSPWGKINQEEFINQAILLATKLTPDQLLEVTQHIESRLGKNKLTHWGPRHIDIDIILYENQVITQKDLTIPHPHMTNRRFVLIPLNQIASEWTHPISKLKISEMLDRCTDTGVVNEIVDL